MSFRDRRAGLTLPAARAPGGGKAEEMRVTSSRYTTVLHLTCRRFGNKYRGFSAERMLTFLLLPASKLLAVHKQELQEAVGVGSANLSRLLSILAMSDVILSSPAVEALPNSRTAALAPAGSSPLLAADDRTLIERAQAGDRHAFEPLVQRYDRQVLRLALNVLGNAEDARDVYQEAFLKIYRNLHRFRFECAFYTWIYRIVTNICLDHLRRRRSHPEEQPPLVRTVSSEERHDGDFFDHQQQTSTYSDPERQTLGREIGRQVEAALKALSPRERMVFEMRHYQGMKLRAIGEALGTTEETVKNSLFRATHKLRSRLEGLR